MKPWRDNCTTHILQKKLQQNTHHQPTHKVWVYKEMMMNDDNVESSLLTSSLLKIHSLYKCCRVISCTCQAGDLDGLNCVVPASMKCVVQVKCVGDLPLFILLESITVYREVQWVAYEHSQ